MITEYWKIITKNTTSNLGTIKMHYTVHLSNVLFVFEGDDASLITEHVMTWNMRRPRRRVRHIVRRSHVETRIASQRGTNTVM